MSLIFPVGRQAKINTRPVFLDGVTYSKYVHRHLLILCRS